MAHRIASRYPSEVIDTQDAALLESGDVVVIRNSKNGGPGHVLLVGDDPRVVWHSLNHVGVCFTSLKAFGDQLHIEKIWRPLEKQRWATPSQPQS